MLSEWNLHVISAATFTDAVSDGVADTTLATGSNAAAEPVRTI